MIITIDGPIATGKSTIAKNLAHEIGFIYFDTGAMYRSLTWGIIKNNVNIDDPQQLEDFLKDYQFEIKIHRGERRYFVGDEDVTDVIRKEEVTHLVSKVSAMPRVRELLLSKQREWAIGVNAVFEGRDMGTVVFPNAEVKVFLTASPEIRAQRRLEELQRKFPAEMEGMTVEKMLAEINERDASDTNRELAPLKKAPDAFVLDTTNLTIDEIVYKILEYKDSLKTKRT